MKEIIESFARAHFVDEWARDQDNKGWPAGDPSGAELMEMAPRTPREYACYAGQWLKEFVAANSRLSRQARMAVAMAELCILYEGFQDKADLNQDTDQSLRGEEMNVGRFGRYLYMEAVGRGVGLCEWVQDHGLCLHEPRFVDCFPEEGE